MLDPQQDDPSSEGSTELGCESSSPSEAAPAQGPQPKKLQRLWIIQQYCNHGTLYDATDR